MIPYTIEKFYPGKLKISSYIFKHLHHPEDAIRAYFSRFTGVKKVRYYKRAGKLVIEYDPENFDLIEFINTLENTKGEILLEDISKEKVSQSTRESSSRWLAITSIGFIPYLLRGVIPNYALAGLTLICAKPLFERFLRSLRNKNLDVHFLDSSAVVIASLTGSPLSAHTMVFLLALGDYLAERVEKKAHSQIEKLFSYREDSAWLATGNGQAIRVKAMDLKEGDLVVVYAGEKVPADGYVEEGEALINQASLTGESNPVHKKKGDKVYAGTYVEDGKIYVRVESVGENTTIAKIARIVEESIKEPINIQRRAEEFANRFVLPTVALALGSYLFTGQLDRLSSTLIIDYHTGVHLTTPLAVLSAVAHASSFGILIKSGSKLETLSRTDTFVLDKTGTLTVGNPSIEDIVGIELPEEKVLLYAASLDQRIVHPVAKAIVKLAQSKGMELIPRENSQYHIGMGIEGELEGTRFMLGSTRFMQKKKIKIGQEVRQLVDKFHSEAKSVLYLVRKKTIVGLLTFRDPIREEAKDVVAELKKMGKRVVLCTGDNEGVARYMSQMLGIDEYYARVFPAEKAQLVQRLQQEGRVVAFVGDGVNDSPALSVANVGISLRSGTDIAIEVADIVIGDSLWHLVDVIDIAHKMLSKLRNIYALNTLFNTVGLMGAVSGLAGPGLSTLINNGSTLLLGLYATKKPKRR